MKRVYIVTTYDEGHLMKKWKRHRFTTMAAALKCIAKAVRSGFEARIFAGWKTKTGVKPCRK